jgi:hypothetical protein
MANLNIGDLAKKVATESKDVSGNTATIKNSIGDGIKSSGALFFFGIVIALICLVFLAVNEGCSVKKYNAYAEVGKKAIEVGSAQALGENEDKLVAIRGKLEYGTVSDNEYGITENSYALQRVVEMCQWKETPKTKDGNTTYEYQKVWNNTRIDDSRFNQREGHINPAMPSDSKFKGEIFRSPTVKLGDFTLSGNQVVKLARGGSVPPPDNIPSMNINGEYLTTYTGTPDIGDLRIMWRKGNASSATLFGKQSNNAIMDYTTKNETKIDWVVSRETTVAEKVREMQDSNKTMTWILRILLIILVCVGFIMMFTPVKILISYIPFIGKFLGAVAGFVAKFVGALLGLALSFLVIAVSWIVVRPLVGVPILVISVGLIVFAVWQGKRKKAAVTGSYSV